MPFCPNCKYEYKEGFTVCSDCGATLVDALTDDVEKNSEIPFEEMTRAFAESLSQEDKERFAEEEKRRHEVPKVYVDASKRADEYKSGAIVLIFMSIIGIIALVLINLGLLPIKLVGASRILIDVVMGALFVIFAVLGISSLGTYRKLLSDVNNEQDIKDRVLDWGKTLTKSELCAGDDPNASDEDNYFFRYEILTKLFDEKFADTEESLRDYLLEEIYNSIFA